MSYFDCTISFDSVALKCDGSSSYGIAILKLENGQQQRISIFLPGKSADRLQRAAEAFNAIMNEVEATEVADLV